MKCRVPFLFKTGRWSSTISSDTSRPKVWFSAPEYVPGRSLEASTCRGAMTRYISYSVLWRSNDSKTFYPRRSQAIVPLRLADDPNTELSVHRLCSIWVNVFKSFDLCVSCISIYCINHISPSWFTWLVFTDYWHRISLLLMSYIWTVFFFKKKVFI